MTSMNQDAPYRETSDRPLAGCLRGEQFQATVVLLAATSLTLCWKYFGSPDFYTEHLSSLFVFRDDPVATAGIYSFLSCFVLMGVIPLLIVKCLFRQSLADYGVRWGRLRWTFGSFAALAPVFLLAAYVGSRDPSVLGEYPINKHAGASPGMFGIHTLTYLMFYLGWEFCFRGFMQHGLRRTMGDANALLVQVAASSLLHIGKPAAESFGAIGAGIVWGVIAFRSRSLLAGLLLHFMLGITLDLLICYG